MRNTSSAYGKVAQLLHWMISLLVFIMIIIGYSADFLKDSIPKAILHNAMNIHKLVGLLILLLMFFRVFWTLANPKPALPSNTLAWQRMAERSVHFLLYCVLIAMPITGWIMSSAAGKPPMFFAWGISLPLAKSDTVSGLFWNAHSFIAIGLITLVSIHILAALYHHFIKKDNVLRRML